MMGLNWSGQTLFRLSSDASKTDYDYSYVTVEGNNRLSR